MKAIITKYLGPTNYKGARIVAYAPDNQRKYYSYPYEYDSEKAHQWAASQYAAMMDWSGQLVSGWTGKEYIHCFADQDTFNKDSFTKEG